MVYHASQLVVLGNHGLELKDRAMKEYPIPLPLMQEIVNVMQTLPWAQVNSVMTKLMPIIQQVDGGQGLLEHMTEKKNGKAKSENKNV